MKPLLQLLRLPLLAACSVVLVWPVWALAQAEGVSDAPGAASAPALPALELSLSPQVRAGVVEQLGVTMRISHPDVPAGQALLSMPLLLVGTPTAAYEAAQIEARDEHGLLALRSADQAPDPSGRYRHYLAERATVGDVRVHYAAAPRAVDASTRNGPLFDLRRQVGGVMGAGVYFLALPAAQTPYRITLSWDLSQLPQGSRGVWSKGEGEQHAVGPAELLRFSFYAAGPLLSLPQDGQGRFSMYWLDQPPFDMPALAEQTGRLYRYMAHLFEDDAADYRVFARANPYPAGGGTALAGSFMFGYGPQGQTTDAGAQMLLAHEMAHTWPKFNSDEAHADTAWYTEGTAEFYSIVLSARAGIIGLDQFLAQLNDRAAAYAANPYRHLTNAEAGERFWSDARAQRVPYGRGLMYLLSLEAQLRARSHGAQGLDALVLEVLHRQKAGETVGNAQWRAMVVRELGAAAGEAFDRMAAGETLVPEPEIFGCLQRVARTLRPFELGFDEMRLGQVNGLRPQSAAAAAGLRDGDLILSSTPLPELKADAQRHMVLKVQREGQTLAFDYLPRGAEIALWQWQRRPGSTDAQCRP